MKSVLFASLLAALVVASVPVRTHNVTISGVVTNASDSTPVLGAQITATGHRMTAVSDAAGQYTLTFPDESLVGRSVELRVRRVGFSPATRVISVRLVTTADFALTPSAAVLEEVDLPGVRVERERAASADAVGVIGRMAVAPMPANQAQGLSVRYRGSTSAMMGRDLDREAYAHIDESGFMAVDAVPLSTFSIDVDRASYSNVRRFINDGVRPPVDAVRIEELINYFPYGYAAVEGEHPFSVTTEITVAPWNAQHRLARIGLQGTRIDLEDAPTSNLVFLLDVSGSMNSPDKLPLLKRSFQLLVNELREHDRVAIVVYAGAAGLVLPSTSGANKHRILAALQQLQAGGSTAGGAGIRLAYRIAQENFVSGGNNRVILATDGDFNVGASSDGEMIRLIEEKREQGTFLTVLGFGTGNLQDAKMEQIADHGNGNFAYIDNLQEARKVLVTEMGGTLLTIAKDVKLQVEFNPSLVRAYRLIGYENRRLAAQDFNDDTKDAGELGAGHSVTALYELVPVGVPMPTGVSTVDSLRYQRTGGAPRPGSDELFFVKVRYKAPDAEQSKLFELAAYDTDATASDDLRFAAAVAGFGMILRDSEHRGDWSLADVSRVARGALGDDPHGYRAEFVQLVERVRQLELLAHR